MYAGRIVEIGECAEVFKNPIHPYTQALLSAFPSVTGDKHELMTLAGESPNLLDPPPGCRFHPRCPLRDRRLPDPGPPDLSGVGTALGGLLESTWGLESCQTAHQPTQSTGSHRPLLEHRGTQQAFPGVRRLVSNETRSFVHAVDGVSFQLSKGRKLRTRRGVRLRQNDHRQAVGPSR